MWAAVFITGCFLGGCPSAGESNSNTSYRPTTRGNVQSDRGSGTAPIDKGSSVFRVSERDPTNGVVGAGGIAYSALRQAIFHRTGCPRSAPDPIVEGPMNLPRSALGTGGDADPQPVEGIGVPLRSQPRSCSRSIARSARYCDLARPDRPHAALHLGILSRREGLERSWPKGFRLPATNVEAPSLLM